MIRSLLLLLAGLQMLAGIVFLFMGIMYGGHTGAEFETPTIRAATCILFYSFATWSFYSIYFLLHDSLSGRIVLLGCALTSGAATIVLGLAILRSAVGINSEGIALTTPPLFLCMFQVTSLAFLTIRSRADRLRTNYNYGRYTTGSAIHGVLFLILSVLPAPVLFLREPVYCVNAIRHAQCLQLQGWSIDRPVLARGYDNDGTFERTTRLRSLERTDAGTFVWRFNYDWATCFQFDASEAREFQCDDHGKRLGPNTRVYDRTNLAP